MIRVLHDNIFIKKLNMVEKEEEKSVFFIPDEFKEDDDDKFGVYKGEVLNVGPGRKKLDGGRYEMSVSEGDIVLYRKYSGHKINIDGDETEYWIIPERDIVCLME